MMDGLIDGERDELDFFSLLGLCMVFVLDRRDPNGYLSGEFGNSWDLFCQFPRGWSCAACFWFMVE